MDVALGVHVGQQNLSMDELRAAWRRFDEAGLDWISAWDHIYEAPPQGGTVDHFEAIATLGALCAETEQARIGCLVFCVTYRNPALLAKAAATLDHISGGRFELGLGAGWHEPEAKAYGYEFPSVGTRLDQLEEAVPMIRSLLTEDRTTHAGKWFRTENASNLPAPQQDRLPIWIGGRGEKRTLPMAARLADGWNAAYVSAEEFGRLNKVLDAACAREGRDPATIQRTVNVQFLCGNTQAEADAAFTASAEQWGAQFERVQHGSLTGTTESAIEQIAAYVEAGAAGVNVALRAPWSQAAVDTYIDEVVPTIRRA